MQPWMIGIVYSRYGLHFNPGPDGRPTPKGLLRIKKTRRRWKRRVPFLNSDGLPHSIVRISRSLVSGRNIMPTTRVMPAKMIGYQRP
jgi:hypothetical protein